MKKLFIIANWMQGKALSGGDRIFIELSKRWSQKLDISIFISKEGADICSRDGQNPANKIIWASDIFSGHYTVDGVYRTIIGIFKALSIRAYQGDIILSSSDFLPDAIPAVILKLFLTLDGISTGTPSASFIISEYETQKGQGSRTSSPGLSRLKHTFANDCFAPVETTI